MTTQRSTGIFAPSHDRLAYVDMLRGMACAWVVLYHAWIDWTVGRTLGSVVVDRLVDAGQLGVDLFLVLSGFCLAYPLLRIQPETSARVDFRPWIARRAWRILPPYYLALLLIGASLLAPQLRRAMPVEQRWSDWSLHILMLHNLSPNTATTICPPYWSLALEFQLYLLFPFALWLLRRTGIRGLIASTVALSLAWSLYCMHRVGPSPDQFGVVVSYYYSVAGRAVQFACGIAAAAFVVRPRRSQEVCAPAIAIVLIPICIFLGSHAAASLSSHLPVSALGLKNVIAGLGFAALVIALKPADTRIHRSRILRPLTKFGVVSYSAYLVHEPLLKFTATAFGYFRQSAAVHHWFFLAFIGWSLVVLAPLAFVFYRFAEFPFLRGAPGRQRKLSELSPNSIGI